MRDYDKIFDDLRNNVISEYVINREEFMDFRGNWISLPDRMNFIGEAGLNGQIIYRYQKQNDSNELKKK